MTFNSLNIFLFYLFVYNEIDNNENIFFIT